MEPQRPTKPSQPQTLKQAQRKASSEDMPSSHHKDVGPGLGLDSLRRAFIRASQRVPRGTLGQASREEAGRFLRSSQKLFQSLRRGAPEHCSATDPPQGAHDSEVPAKAVVGISRQESVGRRPEEPEAEAGKEKNHSREVGETEAGGGRGPAHPTVLSLEQLQQADEGRRPEQGRD